MNKFVLIATFILSLQTFASVQTYYGTAESLKDNKLKYYEVHKIKKDNKGRDAEIKTDYISPTGQVFAEITSTFSRNPFIPEISFNDTRHQIQETTTYDETKKVLRIERTVKGSKKSKTLTFDENSVLGQGFNNFIFERWEQLTEQDSTPFRFIVPAEMDVFSFNAFTAKKDENTVKFSLKFSNWLLRQLVNPIKVTYDKNSKKLLVYEGLSNINDDKNSSQSVLIKYTDSDPRQKPN